MNDMMLHVGMQVDALDTSDIYCPASIISFNKEEIKIRYLGMYVIKPYYFSKCVT